MALTDTQRELARHALGLPGKSCISYRNRFYVGVASPTYAVWMEMVRLGRAALIPPQQGDRVQGFCLTLSGAAAALDPGESLCCEDFPRTVAPEMVSA